MKRILITLAILYLSCPLHASSARAEGETRAPAREETGGSAPAAQATWDTIKKSLPQAQAGWIVSGETTSDAALKLVDPAGQRFSFFYQISYKRIAGVKEENRKLDDAYQESSARHQEAAKTQIEELIKHQTDTSLALRKATRRRNQAEVQRLNDELDETGRKMRAVHEDVDKKISLDVEPYVVKDFELVVRVSVNETTAYFPHDESVPFPDAAFALRKIGERAGTTGWKEGQTLLLFGDWQEQKEQVFIATPRQASSGPMIQTIKVLVTGDRKRVEDLLERMDMKQLRSLMK